MPIPAGPPAGTGLPAGAVLQSRFLTIGESLLFGGVDDLGVRIDLTELKGWDGAIGTTLTSEQRAADHGAWISDGYHPGRTIEASLSLSAGSFLECSQALSRIAGRLPLQEPVSMVVNDHGLELTADVIQSGEFLSSQKGNTARASVALLAPDPRRYSTDEIVMSTGLPATTGGLRLTTRLPLRVQATVVAGLLQATNDGTMATSPVFTVAGPCSPFTLTHRGSGRTIRYHEDVPAGHSVVIDVAARVALLDGVAPRYVTGAWFDYEPGTNEIAFSADSDDPASLLTSRHRHAWK